jgi:hypothetical protein
VATAAAVSAAAAAPPAAAAAAAAAAASSRPPALQPMPCRLPCAMPGCKRTWRTVRPSWSAASNAWSGRRSRRGRPRQQRTRQRRSAWPCCRWVVLLVLKGGGQALWLLLPSPWQPSCRSCAAASLAPPPPPGLPARSCDLVACAD